MNRRNFIETTVLAGGVLALPVDTWSDILPGKKPSHVLIIGAGFAGLAAAYHLKKAGVKTTLLEARTRIGGRVFSYKVPGAENQVIELGAEWVGASHERVISLCKEFNLTLFNNQFDTHLIYNGEYKKAGEWDFSPEMNAFWKKRREIWANMSEKQKAALDKMDWWRYLSKMNLTEQDMDLRELADSTDFGESNRHVSAYAALSEYAESSDKNEMDLKIQGGNDLLASKMADAIGRENILTGKKVLSVKQDKSGVTVTCEGGQTFTAERLICTAPTYSVMKINWDPVLPPNTTDGLNSLQYARIGKFPVVFKERFWGSENFDCLTDGPGHYFYHGTKDQPGKQGVLISYATGDKADVLNAQSPERRLQLILDSLKPAFGDVSKYVQGETKYYWGKDPYSYGAYAIYGKGQWLGLMPELKKPHGRVLFAGEHLADWQGFMEGAINSGEEAAESLL
jgi:monoamine oxidase